MTEHGVQTKHTCGSVEVHVDPADQDRGKCAGCGADMTWNERTGAFIDVIDARYAPGDDVLVIAMPSRGALRVTTRKHSRSSGWWYDVRDAEGYTWVIPEEGIERRIP